MHIYSPISKTPSALSVHPFTLNLFNYFDGSWQWNFNTLLSFICIVIQSLYESCVRKGLFIVCFRRQIAMNDLFFRFVTLIIKGGKKILLCLYCKRLGTGFNWVLVWLLHRVQWRTVKRKKLKASEDIQSVFISSLQHAAAVDSWKLSWWEWLMGVGVGWWCRWSQCLI